jgi:hypothetical protein
VFQRGAALLAARRAETALADLDQAALTLRHVLPVGHATTRLVEATRALALARVGRYREARELLQPLVAAPAPPADQSVAMAFYVTGIVERMSGEPAAALDAEQRALQSMMGGGGVRRMRVLTEIGLTHLDLGDPERAGVGLREALQLSER